MKIFWGINRTDNHHNQKEDDLSSFQVRHAPEGLEKEMRLAQKHLMVLQRKITGPFWHQLIYLSVMLIWIAYITNAIALLLSGVSFTAIYYYSPYFLFISLGAFVVWLLWGYFSRRSWRKARSSIEMKQAIADIRRLSQEDNRILTIPSTALTIDCLAFAYKRHKKNIIPLDEEMYYFFNLPRRAYIENDQLMLADLYQVLAIPLMEIGQPEYNGRSYSIPKWNKKQSVKSVEFHRYHLYSIRFGFNVRGYYRFPIIHINELYWLYLPAYEIKPFMQLIDRD